MIFKDLIKEIPWKEVNEKFPVLYPKYSTRNMMKGYKHVYNTLLKKRPVKSNPPMAIVLAWVPPDKKWDEEGYWSVNGYDGGPESWALDFSSFAKWLGFSVDAFFLSRKDKINLICHCLWEMTFHGFHDKDIQKAIRKINRSMKQIKNGTAKLTELKPEDLTNEKKQGKITPGKKGKATR